MELGIDLYRHCKGASCRTVESALLHSLLRSLIYLSNYSLILSHLPLLINLSLHLINNRVSNELVSDPGPDPGIRQMKHVLALWDFQSGRANKQETEPDAFQNRMKFRERGPNKGSRWDRLRRWF